MADPKRVLLVEDDPDLIDALEETLSQQGYETRHAASETEALEIVRKERIDLVVLDVMLSYRTEGFQIAFDLEADDATRDIPIIMLTAVGRITKFRFNPECEGKPLPVRRFLEKPIRNEVLCSEVQAIIGT
jgi:CheY-like chemotaxis protein